MKGLVASYNAGTNHIAEKGVGVGDANRFLEEDIFDLRKTAVGFPAAVGARRPLPTKFFEGFIAILFIPRNAVKIVLRLDAAVSQGQIEGVRKLSSQMRQFLFLITL